MLDPKQALRDAMTAAGIKDRDERAMIAAIAGGENGFTNHVETSYAHTDNARIRSIFSAGRLAGGAGKPLSEAELNALKADPVKFFDRVYGGRGGNRLGTDDGFNFRGRGPFQLTFRGNYAAVGKGIGVDLTANPDLANDSAVGARTAVEYVLLHYRGGGFEQMLNCVGFNIPDIAATKNALYRKFLRSNEFA